MNFYYMYMIINRAQFQSARRPKEEKTEFKNKIILTFFLSLNPWQITL